MENTNINYREQMLANISDVIEKTGAHDEKYDAFAKARDILDVLESLMAYAIYNTCISTETIRDSAEESYVNIKRRALAMFNKNQNESPSS
ncbi:MAG: hypothetical protein H0W64_10880 [Gammaproteobacteria bacterium]|nr:hypothetical protein [Gammaproteobacteria bacterium]